jgi:RNA polymerase sigma factor (sigma-70 family)
MATAQMGTVLRHIRQLSGGAAPERTDRQLLEDFVARRDEAAFAALVSRHGPMVLRVCRRVLGHEQDAEDAFQATFLVLASAAATIRRREALAGWLHGVARRTAMKSKRTAARRRAREGRPRSPAPPSPPGLLWEEVRTVLDEELGRLAEPFRSAFVLCTLEGKTGPEAAAALGCKEATLYTRMNRARRMLQKALAGRGIELAALLGALTVADGAARTAPAALVRSAVRFGLLVAAGGPAAAIPSHVAALTAGVTRAMSLSKIKIATVVLITAGLFAAGAGVLARQALVAGAPPGIQKSMAGGQQPDRAAARSPASGDQGTITYTGRVLDPEGKPVAGARLYMKGGYRKGEEYSREEPSPVGTTGPEGRFRLSAPKAKPGPVYTVLTAQAANYGAGWVEVTAGGKTENLTLQLVMDDVPIIGQVVDLEGKPVAGATLRLRQINAAPGEDLGPWLEAVKARKGLDTRLPYPYQMLELKYLSRLTDAVSGTATTDSAGRFRLRGVGRNRLARVQLDGPTIVSQFLRIMTRPGEAVEAIWESQVGPRSAWVYYGANFRHAAAPTKPIVGVVRDKDTKEPLAGVTIQNLDGLGTGTNVQTTTDTQGRYRLTGMPKGEGNRITAIPPRDLPYVAFSGGVPNTRALDPVVVDIGLKRGVWIEGKITDKATGKPVRADVEYFAEVTNPYLRDYPGFEAARLGLGEGKEEGSYRIVGLPGPGLVAAKCDEESYLRATERDDGYGKECPEGFLDTLPLSLMPAFYGAVASVDPARAARSVKRDLTLDPGWMFTGTVLGPDGKPLAGARGFGLAGHRWEWDREAGKTAQFAVRAFNPRRPRAVFFQHQEMGLVGVVQPPKANGGAVTVHMGPGATVIGRLVDADGRPRAGVELELSFSTKDGMGASLSPQRLMTDREGRFRAGALLPGYEYQLTDRKGWSPVGKGLRAGRTKDLGDVQMKQE